MQRLVPLSLSLMCYSYYRVFCNTLLIPMSEPSLNDYLLTMYVVAYIHSLTHHFDECLTRLVVPMIRMDISTTQKGRTGAFSRC